MLLHYHKFHTKRLAFAMTDLRRRLDDSVSDVWTWTPTWTMMLLQCRKLKLLSLSVVPGEIAVLVRIFTQAFLI